MGSGSSKSRRFQKEASSILSNGISVCTVAAPYSMSDKQCSSGDDGRPIPLVTDESPDNVRAMHMDDLLGPSDSTTALYRKKKAIGKGAFGEAYIVERNPTHTPPPRRNVSQKMEHPVKRSGANEEQKLFVAKVMDLTSMSSNDRKYAQTEIMCLACNHHFAIIQYYEHFFVYDEDQTLVIITEFADQGDLHRNLYRGKSEWCLTERDAGIYFVQLLLGLDHIHRRRMIHRDVKTANVFLTARGFVKLGDFGFSQQYDSTVSNPIACTFLGTSYYLAPEMWKGQRYGKKADIWAAGIVLCELLGKRRPFEAESLPEMKENVLSGKMWLPPVCPRGKQHEEVESPSDKEYISREMREFLEEMLEQDPEKRPSAGQLLKTPLMQHYLCLFEKRVEKMISLDNELEARYLQNPEDFADAPPVYLLSAEEKVHVMEGIKEGKAMISLETEREIATSDSPRMESVVYKESGENRWKERYLILADGFLTMTLSKGKLAAGAGERSKKVPLNTLNSVVPVEFDTPIHGEGTEHVTLLCGFAISTQNSQSILFATKSEEERDKWMTALIVALKMN